MSKAIPTRVWNAIEMGGDNVIAQELKSDLPGRRKWAAVYAPYKMDFNQPISDFYFSFLTKSKHAKYAVVVFHVSTVAPARECVLEENLENLACHALETVPEILDALDG